ncbi:hypothetical protein XELAEV_18017350mg [Xenopus laevis]|uniref:Uncharacterized protein n=1 Tax=Xenopus laevis TaxID=8355 RepID=A0A974DB09_XENLA|nr:hypothetical protein XELAEV_18017350mg [Xenopus laevis]
MICVSYNNFKLLLGKAPPHPQKKKSYSCLKKKIAEGGALKNNYFGKSTTLFYIKYNVDIPSHHLRISLINQYDRSLIISLRYILKPFWVNVLRVTKYSPGLVTHNNVIFCFRSADRKCYVLTSCCGLLVLVETLQGLLHNPLRILSIAALLF